VIKITIEMTTTTQVPVTKNFITHSEVMLDGAGAPVYDEQEYGSSRRKVARKEDFATKEVHEAQTSRITLLEQEIPDGVAFNLQAVIAAVNNMANVGV
jgi:hypothetical protein